MSIKIICAISQNGVFGIIENGIGKLPFHYPEDLKHFKQKTLNSTIIMGRVTYESIGRPLPKRRNIVITSTNIDGVECYTSLSDAINAASMPTKLAIEPSGTIQIDNPIWLIGGHKIYEDGMNYADEIHLTITPDIISNTNVVKFPFINPLRFNMNSISQLVIGDNNLQYVIYKKI